MFKHHLKRSLAVAAMIATAGFPSAAQAKFIDGGSGASGPVVSSSPAVQPVAVAPSPFQWVDAGIGAGAATLLLGSGAAGIGMMRRHRRTAHS